MGGGIGASWAWKIGCSTHTSDIRTIPGWVSATQSDFAPKSSNGKRDWTTSYKRQLEFYQWLQSAEGGIAVEQPTPGTVDMRNILLVRQRSMVWHMFRILYTLTR